MADGRDLLPPARAASAETGRRCTTTRCTPSSPRTILTNGRDFFPIEAFAGKEFLMPYGRFDIDVGAAFRNIGVEPIIRSPAMWTTRPSSAWSARLGISMMAEMMIRGKLTGVKTPPVRPCVSRELGMGLHPASQAPRHLLPPRMRAGVHRGALKEKSGWRLQRKPGVTPAAIRGGIFFDRSRAVGGLPHGKNFAPSKLVIK